MIYVIFYYVTMNHSTCTSQKSLQFAMTIHFAGLARLGDEHPHHALHHRQCGGTPPLPGDLVMDPMPLANPKGWMVNFGVYHGIAP